MLLFMYHIALCTPSIALVNSGHLLHMWIDHVKLGSEIQAEQVQKEYGDPQAPSTRILTLLLDQDKHRYI
jgi:hypothetical protein